jgi:predicted dehydrogenase
MRTYGTYALHHPDQIRFIAVAEPDAGRRAKFAAQHGIPSENQYVTWEPLLEQPAFGQAALVCTQDQQHTAPTLAALRAGYHVLLEKPMATTPQECRQLVTCAQENDRQLHVCHVLRYTPHFRKMREIIQSGQLGQIVNVSHREDVAWWHMAHAYVRGNWRSESLSAPMILTKCCHDLDILIWMLDRRCEYLSSVGELLHFRSQNAPPGAPARCLDGCPVAGSCPYYAPTLYVDLIPLWQGIAETAHGSSRWAVKTHLRVPGLIKALSAVVPALRQLSDYQGWPRSVLTEDPTTESVMAALRDGPYGRCVYHCDNDVVDHQVVSMRFEGGISVTLTMHGHAHLEGRTTRIEGSRAALYAHFGHGGSWIEVHHHRDDRHQRIDTSASQVDEHGGGDRELMASFVRGMRFGGAAYPLTSARQSLESHLMAFAAEQARRDARVVSMREFRLQI